MKVSVLFISLICSLSIAKTDYLGLDDNKDTQIDPSLETHWESEELNIEQVANLIQGFVNNQVQRRALKKNLDKYFQEKKENKPGEYSRLYSDLPTDTYATRDVHRKTHGCYKANFKVQENIVADLNATTFKITNTEDLGVFKPNAEYDSIVRFSNGHPQNRDDRLPDARGFAVKLLPKGTLHRADLRYQNPAVINNQTTLDILSINFPTFFVNQENTALKYYEINQSFLAGARDFSNSGVGKAQELIALLTSGTNTMELQLALAVNGSIIKSPLFQEYFSMVPSRLGLPNSGQAVKYIWSPSVCPGESVENFEAEKKEEWPAWSNDRSYALNLVKAQITPPNLPLSSYEADYLRPKLKARMASKDFCFSLHVQPFIDQISTNIEDSTDIWLRSEEERQWWLKTIVPSKISVLNLQGSDRDAYVKLIQSKQISAPIFVGTLRIQKLSDNKRKKIEPYDLVHNPQACEDLSFNPWNGNILHHKPLGVVSRMKRKVYNASRRMRHELNKIKEWMIERVSPSVN